MGKDKQLLLKKARKKYLSANLAVMLANVPDSPLNKSYWNTFHCSDTIVVDNGEIHSHYCKNRWCLTCQSIRIATLITKYKDPLSEMSDPYFVTLTARTVPEKDLENRIQKMAKVWREITNIARKKYPNQFYGVRKTECTVRPGGLYHYHYHVICNGLGFARWLQGEWLERMPDTSHRAQDIRKINTENQGFIELFKYFTKLTVKNGKGQRKLIAPSRLDVIFQHMKGRRVYQPFGGFRQADENSWEITPEIVEVANGIYSWYAEDWYNVETGENLSGFQAQTLQTIIENR